MKRKKTLVARCSRVIFRIIFMCLAILGFSLMIISSKLYKNEKFDILEKNSNFFIGGLNNEFSMYHSIDTKSARSQYADFMSMYDMRIFVYDSDGECILSPSEEEKVPLSQSLKNRISKENFLDYDAGMISGKMQSMLFGKKFTLHCDKHDDDVTFYLTAYVYVSEMDNFNIKLLISVIIVITAFSIISYYIVKTQSEKIEKFFDVFSRVVHKYSKGDFSEKIETEMPDELKEICQCIDHLAENVKNADDTSKTFVSNVSHELRTPLTTIGGFIDGILDGTIPKNRQTEYLSITLKEVKRLNMVISCMLNLSKFENGMLLVNFRAANLTDIVINVVLIFEKRIESKSIEIEGLDADALIAEVNPELIQQVIYNLVENAVKFVDEGGTISFKFEKNNDMRIFSIRNTGEGLENSEMQQIFDRFYKTDSSRGKDVTGLGLGLNISKRIVNLHNGKISVKSIKGEYTEFSVQLPAKQNNRKE